MAMADEIPGFNPLELERSLQESLTGEFDLRSDDEVAWAVAEREIAKGKTPPEYAREGWKRWRTSQKEGALESLGKGFASEWEGTKAAWKGGLALGLRHLGGKDTAVYNQLLQSAEGNQEKAAELKPFIGSFGDVRELGDYAPLLFNFLGGATQGVVEAVGSAGLGAGVGFLTGGPGGSVAGGATMLFGKGAAKKVLKKEVADLVEDQAKRDKLTKRIDDIFDNNSVNRSFEMLAKDLQEVGYDATTKDIIKELTQKTTQRTMADFGKGALIGESFVQNSGELFVDLVSRGQDTDLSALTATTTGALNAYLDTFFETKVIDKMFGEGADAARRIAKGKTMDGLKSVPETWWTKSNIGKNVGKGMGVEGLTEMLQESVNMVGVEIADPNAVTPPNAVAITLMDAFAAGSLGGGIFGGINSYSDYRDYLQLQDHATLAGGLVRDFDRQYKDQQAMAGRKAGKEKGQLVPQRQAVPGMYPRSEEMRYSISEPEGVVPESAPMTRAQYERRRAELVKGLDAFVEDSESFLGADLPSLLKEAEGAYNEAYKAGFGEEMDAAAQRAINRANSAAARVRTEQVDKKGGKIEEPTKEEKEEITEAAKDAIEDEVEQQEVQGKLQGIAEADRPRWLQMVTDALTYRAKRTVKSSGLTGVAPSTALKDREGTEKERGAQWKQAEADLLKTAGNYYDAKTGEAPTSINSKWVAKDVADQAVADVAKAHEERDPVEGGVALQDTPGYVNLPPFLQKKVRNLVGVKTANEVKRREKDPEKPKKPAKSTQAKAQATPAATSMQMSSAEYYYDLLTQDHREAAIEELGPDVIERDGVEVELDPEEERIAEVVERLEEEEAAARDSLVALLKDVGLEADGNTLTKALARETFAEFAQALGLQEKQESTEVATEDPRWAEARKNQPSEEEFTDATDMVDAIGDPTTEPNVSAPQVSKQSTRVRNALRNLPQALVEKVRPVDDDGNPYTPDYVVSAKVRDPNAKKEDPASGVTYYIFGPAGTDEETLARPSFWMVDASGYPYLLDVKLSLGDGEEADLKQAMKAALPQVTRLTKRKVTGPGYTPFPPDLVDLGAALDSKDKEDGRPLYHYRSKYRHTYLVLQGTINGETKIVFVPLQAKGNKVSMRHDRGKGKNPSPAFGLGNKRVLTTPEVSKLFKQGGSILLPGDTHDIVLDNLIPLGLAAGKIDPNQPSLRIASPEIAESFLKYTERGAEAPVRRKKEGQLSTQGEDRSDDEVSAEGYEVISDSNKSAQRSDEDINLLPTTKDEWKEHLEGRGFKGYDDKILDALADELHRLNMAFGGAPDLIDEFFSKYDELDPEDLEEATETFRLWRSIAEKKLIWAGEEVNYATVVEAALLQEGLRERISLDADVGTEIDQSLHALNQSHRSMLDLEDSDRDQSLLALTGLASPSQDPQPGRVAEEPGEDDDLRESRGVITDKGPLHHKAVRNRVAQLEKALGMPKGSIEVVTNLPDHVEGKFNRKTRKLYINGNLDYDKDNDRVAKVIFHELSHRGLAYMFSRNPKAYGRFLSLMRSFEKTNMADLDKLAKTYKGKKYSQLDSWEKTVVAEELMANKAENWNAPENKTIWTKIKEAFRQIMKTLSLNPALEWTDREVSDFVRQAVYQGTRAPMAAKKKVNKSKPKPPPQEPGESMQAWLERSTKAMREAQDALEGKRTPSFYPEGLSQGRNVPDFDDKALRNASRLLGRSLDTNQPQLTKAVRAVLGISDRGLLDQGSLDPEEFRFSINPEADPKVQELGYKGHEAYWAAWMLRSKAIDSKLLKTPVMKEEVERLGLKVPKPVSVKYYNKLLGQVVFKLKNALEWIYTDQLKKKEKGLRRQIELHEDFAKPQPGSEDYEYHERLNRRLRTVQEDLSKTPDLSFLDGLRVLDGPGAAAYRLGLQLRRAAQEELRFSDDLPTAIDTIASGVYSWMRDTGIYDDKVSVVLGVTTLQDLKAAQKVAEEKGREIKQALSGIQDLQEILDNPAKFAKAILKSFDVVDGPDQWFQARMDEISLWLPDIGTSLDEGLPLDAKVGYVPPERDWSDPPIPAVGYIQEFAPAVANAAKGSIKVSAFDNLDEGDKTRVINYRVMSLAANLLGIGYIDQKGDVNRRMATMDIRSSSLSEKAVATYVHRHYEELQRDGGPPELSQFYEQLKRRKGEVTIDELVKEFHYHTKSRQTEQLRNTIEALSQHARHGSPVQEYGEQRRVREGPFTRRPILVRPTPALLFASAIGKAIYEDLEKSSMGIPVSVRGTMDLLDSVQAKFENNEFSSPKEMLAYYKKLRFDYAESHTSNLPAASEGAVWKMLPQKKKALKEDIEILQILSHPGWCTTGARAQDYRERGDFFILYKENKPWVAVSMRGTMDDGGTVTEARDFRNSGIGSMFYRDVAALVEDNGLAVGGSATKTITSSKRDHWLQGVIQEYGEDGGQWDEYGTYPLKDGTYLAKRALVAEGGAYANQDDETITDRPVSRVLELTAPPGVTATARGVKAVLNGVIAEDVDFPDLEYLGDGDEGSFIHAAPKLKRAESFVRFKHPYGAQSLQYALGLGGLESAPSLVVLEDTAGELRNAPLLVRAGRVRVDGESNFPALEEVSGHLETTTDAKLPQLKTAGTLHITRGSEEFLTAPLLQAAKIVTGSPLYAPRLEVLDVLPNIRIDAPRLHTVNDFARIDPMQVNTHTLHHIGYLEILFAEDAERMSQETGVSFFQNLEHLGGVWLNNETRGTGQTRVYETGLLPEGLNLLPDESPDLRTWVRQELESYEHHLYPGENLPLTDPIIPPGSQLDDLDIVDLNNELLPHDDDDDDDLLSIATDVDVDAPSEAFLQGAAQAPSRQAHDKAVQETIKRVEYEAYHRADLVVQEIIGNLKRTGDPDDLEELEKFAQESGKGIANFASRDYTHTDIDIDTTKSVGEIEGEHARTMLRIQQTQLIQVHNLLNDQYRKLTNRTDFPTEPTSRLIPINTAMAAISTKIAELQSELRRDEYVAGPDNKHGTVFQIPQEGDTDEQFQDESRQVTLDDKATKGQYEGAILALEDFLNERRAEGDTSSKVYSQALSQQNYLIQARTDGFEDNFTVAELGTITIGMMGEAETFGLTNTPEGKELSKLMKRYDSEQNKIQLSLFPAVLAAERSVAGAMKRLGMDREEVLHLLKLAMNTYEDKTTLAESMMDPQAFAGQRAKLVLNALKAAGAADKLLSTGEPRALATLHDLVKTQQRVSKLLMEGNVEAGLYVEDTDVFYEKDEKGNWVRATATREPTAVGAWTFSRKMSRYFASLVRPRNQGTNPVLKTSSEIQELFNNSQTEPGVQQDYEAALAKLMETPGLLEVFRISKGLGSKVYKTKVLDPDGVRRNKPILQLPDADDPGTFFAQLADKHGGHPFNYLKNLVSFVNEGKQAVLMEEGLVDPKRIEKESGDAPTTALKSPLVIGGLMAHSRSLRDWPQEANEYNVITSIKDLEIQVSGLAAFRAWGRNGNALTAALTRFKGRALDSASILEGLGVPMQERNLKRFLKDPAIIEAAERMWGKEDGVKKLRSHLNMASYKGLPDDTVNNLNRFFDRHTHGLEDTGKGRAFLKWVINGMLQNPGSAITIMNESFPFFNEGFDKYSRGKAGDTFKHLVLEALLKPLAVTLGMDPDKDAKLQEFEGSVGFRLDPASERTLSDIVAPITSARGPIPGEVFDRMTEVLQRPIRSKNGQAGVRWLAPFTHVTEALRKAILLGNISSFTRQIQEVMAYYQEGGESQYPPGFADNPVRREFLNRFAEVTGMELSLYAKKAIANEKADRPMFDKRMWMGMLDWAVFQQGDSHIGNLPVGLMHSRGSVLSILYKWSILRGNELNRKRITSKQEERAIAALGMKLLLMVAPSIVGGMAVNWMRELYMERLLQKRRNMRQLGEIFQGGADDMFLGILEQTASAGVLGYWGDLLDTMTNITSGEGTSRGLSVDSRVVVISQLQALMNAARFTINTQDVDYTHVVRPVLNAVGGASMIQSLHLVDRLGVNLFDWEQNTARRGNVANTLSTWGKMLDYENKVWFGGVKPTKMSAELTALEFAIYEDNEQDFAAAWNRAINEAVRVGKAPTIPKAREYVRKSLQARHPLRKSFQKITRRQYHTMLDKMDSLSEQVARDAVDRWNRYLPKVKGSPFEGTK